jgi:hypothetical protein
LRESTSGNIATPEACHASITLWNDAGVKAN